jgi:hypothetical protein
MNVENIEDIFYLYVHETDARNYYLTTRSGQKIKISFDDFKKLVSILGAV